MAGFRVWSKYKISQPFGNGLPEQQTFSGESPPRFTAEGIAQQHLFIGFHSGVSSGTGKRGLLGGQGICPQDRENAQALCCWPVPCPQSLNNLRTSPSQPWSTSTRPVTGGRGQVASGIPRMTCMLTLGSELLEVWVVCSRICIPQPRGTQLRAQRLVSCHGIEDCRVARSHEHDQPS
jgi:hypothetical protein